MVLSIQEISETAFKRFGNVAFVGEGFGRRDLHDVLLNRRLTAKIVVSIIELPPIDLPLCGNVVERHKYSSQLFFPLICGGFVIVVAEGAGDAKPCVSDFKAFYGAAGTVFSYHPNVWHTPLIAFGRRGIFATALYKDGTPGDEQFIDLGEDLVVG